MQPRRELVHRRRTMANLPSGTVTFLFTDIEGSTRLWQADPDAMRLAIDRHLSLLGEAIAASGGVHFKTVGDSIQVVIASGATELPIPIPGWTLPGVMTIGAGQVLATQHRVRPSASGVVVGINPLSLAISHELQMAGTDILAIVNIPPGPLVPAGNTPAEVVANLARASHLAPSRALRALGRLGAYRWTSRLAAQLQPAGGLLVWGIPVNPRRTVTMIQGSRQVEAVELADLTAAGDVKRTREVPVDAVYLAGGLRPLSELAALAGCKIIAAPDLGGTIPLYGPGLQTTAPGIHVAGNIVGIESALVAMAQGRLAAAAIAAPHLVQEERRNVARARRDAPISFLPAMRRGRKAVVQAWSHEQRDADSAVMRSATAPPAVPRDDPLRHLPEDLIVCRCEGVTVGAIRRVATDGAVSAEEIKRFTRMTMGSCQGRVCQGILERIEGVYTGEVVSRATLPGHRPPIRPVTLGEIAALADGSEEWERLHGMLRPSLPFDDRAGGRLADPRL